MSGRRLLALVGLLVVLATGCRLDVTVETEVRKDGSGAVRVAVAADDELLARAPSALADLRLDDLRASGWTATGPQKEDDGRTWVRLEKPFASVDEAAAILQSLNGAQGPLLDVRLTSTTEGTDTALALDATARLDGGIEAFADSALVQTAGGAPFATDLQAAGTSVDQGLGLSVAVTLPGTVTAPGATLDGDTATWTAPLGPGQATVISARAEWSDDGPDRFRLISRVALGALIAYVVAMLGFLGWRVRRSRSR